MDDSAGSDHSMEHVVQGKTSALYLEDDDNLSYFEDTAYARHYSKYRAMQGLGDLGVCKQIPDHGPHLIRDTILDNPSHKCPRDSQGLGDSSFLCVKRRSHTYYNCLRNSLPAL